ncbi:MAG: hypothetical protein EOM64_08180 [Erysipelotrichia bacterium]|nr:hypothetical protein [Erysipelotrichia bacterium]
MSKSSQRKNASEASVQELKASSLNAGSTPSAVIMSRSNFSIYVILLFAVILIALKILAVIGWILLILSGVMLVIGRNLKQFAFYSDFMVIYALDQSDICWKIPYSTIKNWHMKRSLIGFNTLYIETEGNTAQKIEAKLYQYHAMKKAMIKHLADKELKTESAQQDQR